MRNSTELTDGRRTVWKVHPSTFVELICHKSSASCVIEGSWAGGAQFGFVWTANTQTIHHQMRINIVNKLTCSVDNKRAIETWIIRYLCATRQAMAWGLRRMWPTMYSAVAHASLIKGGSVKLFNTAASANCEVIRKRQT